MPYLLLQSPLVNFANLIAAYLAEIWDFLIFIGQVPGVIIVLAGAIHRLTETNQSRGKGLVFSGILPSIVIEYFIISPPSLVLA